MAYAAYREHPGVTRTRSTMLWHVLDVIVTCADAQRVRVAIARCPDAGVVRCEPLLCNRGSQESAAPRVRLMVRLPLTGYAQVLHCLVEAVPSGEVGRLVSWRDHLTRCGLRHSR
ncbi:hypothetical protein QTH90_28660 [Variovorax sp. J2P1-59]|uniref:hypothetical protein n=1 Tax=Variovorax flavidus TaxID=3053501 RepID=UPI00257690CB|nr:hypothetical protein [Variovorax sp. J2P1-59]MDM0078409.1 hypothetical protein [Variovorax sp. J2P1-59]